MWSGEKALSVPCCPAGVRTYEFEFTCSVPGAALFGDPIAGAGAEETEEDAFFNHLLVQPDFSAVVLGNSKRRQVSFIAA